MFYCQKKRVSDDILLQEYFLLSSAVEIKNQYVDEDNKFRGFMLVAVPAGAKTEEKTAGKFHVSVSTCWWPSLSVPRRRRKPPESFT